MLGTDVLSLSLFGNSLQSWILAALVFVVTAVGVRLMLVLAIARVRKLAARTRTGLDDGAVSIVARTQWWVLVVLGLYAGARFLALPEAVERGLGNLVRVVLIVQVGIWAAPWWPPRCSALGSGAWPPRRPRPRARMRSASSAGS